jgi:serine/threonine-protein phosphatase 2A activator
MLLADHPRLHPKSFPNPEIAESFAKDFMFLGCIKFIFQVKNGPFAEHSNQLWNISGVPNWSKVNGGLIKMYKAEVVLTHFNSFTYCISFNNLVKFHRYWLNFL